MSWQHTFAIGAAFGALVVGGASEAGEFEQDREAILAMAGKYKVGFHFHETVGLHADYQVKEKHYDEEAHEWVVVAEDSGERIVLQHILQVGDEVVKHWGQIWTYEDTEILEYQGGQDWKQLTLEAGEVEGTWSQFVTQTNEMPRYEAVGTWVHHDGASYWQGECNRPLPRREYSKRDDYDLLRAMNRQTVSEDGWVHEQDNVKWVKREGKHYPLCREVGYNTYDRVEDYDFSGAVGYWEKTSGHWKAVRAAWSDFYAQPGGLRVKDLPGLQTIRRTLSDLLKEEKLSPEKAREALTPFIGKLD